MRMQPDFGEMHHPMRGAHPMMFMDGGGMGGFPGSRGPLPRPPIAPPLDDEDTPMFPASRQVTAGGSKGVSRRGEDEEMEDTQMLYMKAMMMGDMGAMQRLMAKGGPGGSSGGGGVSDGRSRGGDDYGSTRRRGDRDRHRR